MKKVISIDFGTTSVKTALIDEDGNLLGFHCREYQLITPLPGWVEADPEIYWKRLPETIGRTLAQAGVSAEDVSAMSLSSQGQTFIPLDRHGNPLTRAMVWLDRRAQSQAQMIQAKFGQRDYYKHTGYPTTSASLTASMLLWLKDNSPDVFNSAARFALIRDFIALRACGRAVIDETGAVASGLYDIQQRCWWPELLAWIGLDQTQLPSVVPSGQIIGELTTDAAAFLGLAPGTPLVSGAWDQLAASIGAGSPQSHLVTETTGTALAVVATTDSLILDDQARLLSVPHALPGKGALLPYAPTSGILLKWLRDELSAPGTTYEDLTTLAAQVPPGARGIFFLPHFAGTGSPDFDPSVRGAIVGLQLAHTRADICRALLESLAFLLRDCLDVIKELNVQPRAVRMLGGGARNQLLCQIKADLLGIPAQTMAFPEAALMGNTILALVGIGHYKSVEQATSRMVRTDQTYDPDPSNRQCYEHGYQRYKELTHRICPHPGKLEQ